MKEPRWLSQAMLRAIHSDQIRAHGGALGIRDRGLLESALHRPLNRLQYEPEASLHSLAAAYGFGIVRNHPFIDGNKRVGFQAMYVFLGLNGLRITAPEEALVHLMLSLAGGDLDEPDLATWLEENGVPG